MSDQGIMIFQSSSLENLCLRKIFNVKYDSIGVFYENDLIPSKKHVLILDLWTLRIPAWTEAMFYDESKFLEICDVIDVYKFSNLKDSENPKNFKSLLSEVFEIPIDVKIDTYLDCLESGEDLPVIMIINYFLKKLNVKDFRSSRIVGFFDSQKNQEIMYKENLNFLNFLMTRSNINILKNIFDIESNPRIYETPDNVYKTTLQSMITTRTIELKVLKSLGFQVHDNDCIIILKSEKLTSNEYLNAKDTIKVLINNLKTDHPPILDLNRLIRNINVLTSESIEEFSCEPMVIGVSSENPVILGSSDPKITMVSNTNYNITTLTTEHCKSLSNYLSNIENNFEFLKRDLKIEISKRLQK